MTSKKPSSLGPIRKPAIGNPPPPPLPSKLQIKRVIAQSAPSPPPEPESALIPPISIDLPKQEDKIDLTLPHNAVGLFWFYNFMFAQRGITVPYHLLHLIQALADKRIPKLLVIVGPGSGKAVHPDTSVLTPKGWVLIKDLSLDDRIVRPFGGTARIRAITKQSPTQLWRITFADGRQALAHSDHLWRVHHKKFSREKRGERGQDGLIWDLATTEEIAKRLVSDKNLRWYIPLTGPVDFGEKVLPVPPYTLGVILGDGHIDKCGFPVIANPDIEIRKEVEKELESTRFTLSDRRPNISNCPVWSIRGIGPDICAIGLRKKLSHEKFIPDIYKQGSIEQRLAIIQGLMDTDGSLDNSATFATTSARLAEDVREVLWSLGAIVKISTRQTSFTYKGVKKKGKISYRLNIRFPYAGRLFRLPKKKNNVKANQYSDTLKLRIMNMEREVDKSESICISLDSGDGLFLIKDFIVTHNSLAISVVYPAFTLGTDPTMTVLGISAAEALMQGFQTAVGDWIEHSPIWKILFPRVTPDKDKGWSTERGLFVKGHPAGDPDASYFAVGLTSKALTGKHARLLIGDDLHDKENSQSAEACLRVRESFYRQIIGRADPRGARFIFAGRRWHQEDLYGHLKSTGEWVVMELPAFRDGSDKLFWNVTVPDGLECCFTKPEPMAIDVPGMDRLMETARKYPSPVVKVAEPMI